ncbi:hypothetical protein JTB14_002862 [Gonioctena quinquepunctata]|nr:hypothetical protein JTB14_002862 [Gonioctena quinquepunctata]
MKVNLAVQTIILWGEPKKQEEEEYVNRGDAKKMKNKQDGVQNKNNLGYDYVNKSNNNNNHKGDFEASGDWKTVSYRRHPNYERKKLEHKLSTGSRSSNEAMASLKVINRLGWIYLSGFHPETTKEDLLKCLDVKFADQYICEKITKRLNPKMLSFKLGVPIQLEKQVGSPNGEFGSYMSKTNELLSKLDHKKNIIITGDFNVNFNPMDNQAHQLCNLFVSYGLHYTVSIPTKAINFYFKKEKNRETTSRINFRPITEAGLFTLYKTLENVNWNEVNDKNQETQVRFENFINIINNAIEFSLPKKSKLSTKSNKITPKINWFNDDLIQIRETLRFMNDVHKKNPEVIPKENIREYKRFYRTSLSNAKREAHDVYIKNSSNKQTAMWKVIKGNNPITKSENGQNLSAENFNVYFSRIAEDLVENLPQTPSNPAEKIKLDKNLNFCFRENGVAERLDRTPMETARSILFQSKLDESFWAEAVNTAAYHLKYGQESSGHI